MPFWRTHVLAFGKYLESAGLRPDYVNPIGSILPDAISVPRNMQAKRSNHYNNRCLSELLRYAYSVDDRRDDIWEIALGMANHIETDNALHYGIFFTKGRKHQKSIERVLNGNKSFHRFAEASLDRAVNRLDPDISRRMHRAADETDFGRVSYHLGECFDMPYNGYPDPYMISDRVREILGSNISLVRINGASGMANRLLNTVGIRNPQEAERYVESLSEESSRLMQRDLGDEIRQILCQ